jgi:pyruvate dehydrogenase E2 component (dihydrolipoamide acetyltransferase)
MPQEVRMPQMGESITEGTVVRWLKKPGDSVKRDEMLLEIETDKVNTEIPSPGDGILAEIRVIEGQRVPIDTVLCILAGPGEESLVRGAPAAPARAAEKAAPAAPRPAARPAPAAPASAGRAEPPSPPPAAAAAPRPPAPHVERSQEEAEEGEEAAQRSSPLVRKIAQEHGIDIATVPGTGMGGRVTKKDILDFISRQEGEAAPEGAPPAVEAPPEPEPGAAPAPSAAEVLPGGVWDPSGVRVEPMSIMRAKIAEHMIASRRTSAHVTTFHEVDLTEVARVREARKDNFLRETGAKLTFLPFIIKAAVDALKEFPIVNASVVGKELHYHRDVHLGVAVALQDGLIVPVIRHAEEKSILGIARALADLAERARSKRLAPDEVQGGTFTVTNFGSFGSIFATPIINQPQVAILGVGAATKRPVVLAETESIAIRMMVYLSLSFDHRVIDGAVADQFLSRVRTLLERGPFAIT